jgi:hypothetical protein
MMGKRPLSVGDKSGSFARERPSRGKLLPHIDQMRSDMDARLSGPIGQGTTAAPPLHPHPPRPPFVALPSSVPVHASHSGDGSSGSSGELFGSGGGSLDNADGSTPPALSELRPSSVTAISRNAGPASPHSVVTQTAIELTAAKNGAEIRYSPSSMQPQEPSHSRGAASSWLHSGPGASPPFTGGSMSLTAFRVDEERAGQMVDPHLRQYSGDSAIGVGASALGAAAAAAVAPAISEEETANGSPAAIPDDVDAAASTAPAPDDAEGAREAPLPHATNASQEE